MRSQDIQFCLEAAKVLFPDACFVIIYIVPPFTNLYEYRFMISEISAKTCNHGQTTSIQLTASPGPSYNPKIGRRHHETALQGQRDIKAKLRCHHKNNGIEWGIGGKKDRSRESIVAIHLTPVKDEIRTVRMFVFF